MYFLSGSLPIAALLHLRQLSLFSMITRLPENILNKIARLVLTTSKDTYKSWFNEIKSICVFYGLPHPLSLLNHPLSKEASKRMFKSRVITFWESKLRSDARPLPSLAYFKPEFMSLQTPHPLWTSCGSNPYEICKAVIQAKMLSGRYRTDQLLRHFSENDGFCSLCKNEDTTGSIEHLLTQCPVLTDTRNCIWENLSKNTHSSEITKSLIYFV